ncbi:cyclic lactone autoinducer peptide [Clostridium collagenovorans DSM 3089]|uniref:Cyclic lactone autoinducer peptide n=1 Tax=Clostridium collagenovorans DSM 3089 TaxID=1121306 RepID=A0A1M5V1W7_9CLOT|nr:cyclic lactone autoinducer peptide [Clostridium collagenovorans]SHH69098.1 cyclic lactone autoinducer peptide [Clostridium collagenovorans DSM 3089]
MKKFVQKYGTVLTALALMVTAHSASTCCYYVLHQPELPKGAKALRKF